MKGKTNDIIYFYGTYIQTTDHLAKYQRYNSISNMSSTWAIYHNPRRFQTLETVMWFDIACFIIPWYRGVIHYTSFHLRALVMFLLYQTGRLFLATETIKVPTGWGSNIPDESKPYIDGLVQDCSNSSVIALALIHRYLLFRNTLSYFL